MAQGATGAAGYIYANNTSKGEQLFFFGRHTGPSTFLYRVMATKGDNKGKDSTDHFIITVSADMSPWSNLGLDRIGEKRFSLDIKISGQSPHISPSSFSIAFNPDHAKAANSLFQTSNDLSGVVIETRSTEWTCVAVLAILCATGVALAAMETDTEVTMEAEASGTGGGKVKIKIGRGDKGEEGEKLLG